MKFLYCKLKSKIRIWRKETKTMPSPKRTSVKGQISKERKEFGSCLICWKPLEKKGSTNAEKLGNLFHKMSSIFKIHLSTSTWDFGIEAFPFCGNCNKEIQQLSRLQDKLDAIQKEIEAGIEKVKKKLRESDHTFISTDLRVISFRSQVSGHLGGKSLESQGLYKSNLIQPSPSISSGIYSHSAGTNPNNSTGFQFQPLHGLQNALADFSGLTSNLNLTSHQAIQIRPDDFGNVGLVEVQIESCNTIVNDGTEDDSCSEIVDDANDEDYSPSANYDRITDRRKKIASSSNRKLKSKGPIIRKKSSKKVKDINIDFLSDSKVEQGSQSKSKEVEYFLPLKTTNDGKMYFDSVEISKNELGYVCGICGYNKVKGHSSISLRKMKIHIKGVHFDAYKCEICKKSFTSNDILNQHTKRTHVLEKIPCDICQKLIVARGCSMKAHLWTHKNLEEKAEARALGLEPQETIHTKALEIDGKHKCPKCGKPFIKPNRLKVHMKTHLAPELRKDLKCPNCDKRFTSRISLRHHVNTRHDLSRIVRWFHCAVCHKRFLQKSSRDQHILRFHTPHEKKEFTCSICNKRHGMLSDLKIHLKNHRPAEDFKTHCDICGLRMLNTDTLRDHRKKYHPRPKPTKITVDINIIKNQAELDDENLSERKKMYKMDGTLRKINERFKPLETKDDGKLYYEGYEVLKLKEEGGFSCVTCDSDFRSDSNRRLASDKAVKIHIKGAHLGNYSCFYCNKKFKNNNRLISHNHKVHYLVKQKCTTCGMELDRKKYRSHLWSHKNQEEMVIALNSGEPIPPSFKYLKYSLARKVEENVAFGCGDCSESFSTPVGLDDHRIGKHPAKILRQYHKFKSKNLETEVNESKVRESSRFKNRKRKKLPNFINIQSSSESEIDSLQSDIDQSNKIFQPSVRKLHSRSRRSRITRPERKAEVVKLKSLPKSLVNAKNIKVISDELISYVSSTTGKRKLISLDHIQDAEDSSNAGSSDGEILGDEHESENLSEMDCKLFPDPEDSFQSESVFKETK